LAHRTLTNSDAGRQSVEDAESVPPRKIVVLENGVDLSRFERHPPPDTAGSIVRIGAVGNLRPVKNIDGLIRAARELCRVHPRLEFEVAGDGPQRQDLERLISECGIIDRFRLRGSVADVPAFLARQDIAVLPSHSEGMSNALLEYMASGRCIIATDVGANSRLIAHGEAGLLVPPGDETALVRAIEQVLNDPQLAARLGRNARARAESEFSREAMCRRFEEFYLSLSGRNPSCLPNSE
jgi:glycosyltransferase involved in cell wall biosynthesis